MVLAVADPVTGIEFPDKHAHKTYPAMVLPTTDSVDHDSGCVLMFVYSLEYKLFAFSLNSINIIQLIIIKLL